MIIEVDTRRIHLAHFKLSLIFGKFPCNLDISKVHFTLDFGIFFYSPPERNLSVVLANMMLRYDLLRFSELWFADTAQAHCARQPWILMKAYGPSHGRSVTNVVLL